jgi:hypothetical protein
MHDYADGRFRDFWCFIYGSFYGLLAGAFPPDDPTTVPDCSSILFDGTVEGV